MTHTVNEEGKELLSLWWSEIVLGISIVGLLGHHVRGCMGCICWQVRDDSGTGGEIRADREVVSSAFGPVFTGVGGFPQAFESRLVR